MACTTTLVATDPQIWVVDDCLPPEFVQMVNAAFDSKDGGAKCQVVKPNGREIVARNIDFDVKDKLCQEVFQRISDLCGAGAVAFNQFMVSEVWASGQDAHVDHVNVDDVGAKKMSFLDMTLQSHSEAEPRRVVPTVSIIVYFNAVGGIRFPKAKGMQTISAKTGRMVLFHNYDDESRPTHRDSAVHHGIYFEKLPKRVLIMGVLANHTPQFNADPKQKPLTHEALLYCAGTKRDPLFHDSPAYDVYKIPEPVPDREGVVKTDLILTLNLTYPEYGGCSVQGHNGAGEMVYSQHCASNVTVQRLRGHIKAQVDQSNAHNVILCLPNGQLLTEEHDESTLKQLETAVTQTSCGCSCKPQ